MRLFEIVHFVVSTLIFTNMHIMCTFTFISCKIIRYKTLHDFDTTIRIACVHIKETNWSNVGCFSRC